jgi:hypothetical protein
MGRGIRWIDLGIERPYIPKQVTESVRLPAAVSLRLTHPTQRDVRGQRGHFLVSLGAGGFEGSGLGCL